MTRWILVVVLFSFAFCGPSDVLADAPPLDKPVLVSGGQPAPFTGMLVPVGMAAELTAKAEFCGERIAKAREEERAVSDLTVQLHKDMRRSDKEAFDLKLQVMNDTLAEIEPSWYEHPILWYGIGIVSAILVVWGSVEVYKAIAPDFVMP